MILKSLEGALVLDKPAGIATHTPDAGKTEGFLEMASRLLGRPFGQFTALIETLQVAFLSASLIMVLINGLKLSPQAKRSIFSSHQ